jgi:methyl-accepting chemotaxis protein
MVRELNELIEGLDQLATGLAAPRTETGDGTARTPAQLVDAVVHTAADGIEDLAAGLMRANELAGVAERLTNKATLLALNAALEATRSGSEAFAAIAEETRRLAEFAREATDTISRLSSEIEYKVTETITAIHATSEDAKSAVASFQSAPGDAGPRVDPATVQRLLRRAQQLKRLLIAEAA